MNDAPFDGGVGMSSRESIPNDNVTDPDRDTEAISDTLLAVDQHDLVKIGIAIEHPATGRTGGTSVMKVLSVEQDVGGFDHRINLLHHDGDVFRIYITGISAPDHDAWEIVSMPYDPGIGLADATDLAFHGWIVGAEIQDGDRS